MCGGLAFLATETAETPIGLEVMEHLVRDMYLVEVAREVTSTLRASRLRQPVQRPAIENDLRRLRPILSSQVSLRRRGRLHFPDEEPEPLGHFARLRLHTAGDQLAGGASPQFLGVCHGPTSCAGPSASPAAP